MYARADTPSALFVIDSGSYGAAVDGGIEQSPKALGCTVDAASEVNIFLPSDT